MQTSYRIFTLFLGLILFTLSGCGGAGTTETSQQETDATVTSTTETETVNTTTAITNVSGANNTVGTSTTETGSTDSPEISSTETDSTDTEVTESEATETKTTESETTETEVTETETTETETTETETTETGTTETETTETTTNRLPIEVSSKLTIPEVINNYSTPALPAHFNTPVVRRFDNTLANNLITNEGATLGRVLFYEKQLSANGTIACASCHKQANGFTDPDRFSTGFQGGLIDRNSMALANSRYYENGHFFWDERANTLEDQTLIPIQNSVEMGLTLVQAVSNIESQPYYSFLFGEAFGDSTVTAQRISFALAQFVRSLVSFESKYDAGVATNFANFTATENRGRGLFFSRRTNCARCHVNSANNGNRAIFQPSRTFNNGLDAALVNDDNGVGDVSNNQNQNGLFKVGSLRNIELTAPYMHDGRFATLAEVIEHYNSGIQNHPNLDNRLRQGGVGGPGGGAPRRMNLTDQEKLDLVAFMLTLTDDTYLTEEKFSNPFIAP